MKIKNDYVNIKIGKKTYELRNMIFDNYIQYLIDRSLESEKISDICALKAVYIKLDTPITGYSYNTEISTDQFDFWFAIDIEDFEQELNRKNIVATYQFRRGQNEGVVSINDTTRIRELNFFNGRKICNIGFGFSPEWHFSSYSENTAKIGAIVDTSNYNIYIEENEILSITRRDIISTDAAFSSNMYSKVPAPAHLAPALLDSIIEPSYISKKCSGLLYSLSTSRNGINIEKEYIFGTDITATRVGNSIEISAIDNTNEKYLSFLGNDGNMYLGDSYLVKPKINYIILKYKVMQLVGTTPTDTGYYYTLKFRTKITGDLITKINYERGE